MKWLKRGFWAAAWACWVWCAVKLGRELPRPANDTRGDSVPLNFVGPFEIELNDGEPDILYIGDDTRIAVTTVSFRPADCDRVGSFEFIRLQAGGVWTNTFETFAVHDRRGLIFRQWGVPSNPTQAVLVDPLPVNWPLLTLCQTILALPLILLWAALRWRRNRRLRLVSVSCVE